jgi:hypothetical protein
MCTLSARFVVRMEDNMYVKDRANRLSSEVSGIVEYSCACGLMYFRSVMSLDTICVRFDYDIRIEV